MWLCARTWKVHITQPTSGDARHPADASASRSCAWGSSLPCALCACADGSRSTTVTAVPVRTLAAIATVTVAIARPCAPSRVDRAVPPTVRRAARATRLATRRPRAAAMHFHSRVTAMHATIATRGARGPRHLFVLRRALRASVHGGWCVLRMPCLTTCMIELPAAAWNLRTCTRIIEHVASTGQHTSD